MTVKASKKGKRESNGWKVGPAEEFLDLSSEEVAYIEMKLALSKKLKDDENASACPRTISPN